MADSPGERPPSDAEGLDRPSENEAQLDDLHDEFDEPSRVEAADPAGPDSDDESLLSEVDEAQFADFDPTAVQVAPDFDTLNKAIKVKKRKRAEGDDEASKKKKLEQESGLERTVEDKTAMMAFLVVSKSRGRDVEQNQARRPKAEVRVDAKAAPQTPVLYPIKRRRHLISSISSFINITTSVPPTIVAQPSREDDLPVVYIAAALEPHDDSFATRVLSTWPSWSVLR
ncbi:Transcription factor iws1 [Exophiala xenobiotica]|nr:Transcription factor iws1 [Exophiala xenobiotica]